ncbi:MAG TPA: 8-amino-7-oxononanoate synthase [Fibrobacteraceae bacterium]|nr:8-amino-7-oxononanoate synthase [Fibrobacteraceae bacterium]
MRSQSTLRHLPTSSQPPVNFASNDYLDLARHPALAEACAQAARRWGTGSTGSRLLTGSPAIFEETEQFLASWKGSEAALLFNTGYAANLALVDALSQGKYPIFLDRLDHASIYDGARLSGAPLHRFRHNDPEDLEHLLQRYPGPGWIFTESVFSMDGDLAPLDAYAELAQRYDVGLVVDEAHAEGVFGPGGRGRVHELGLQHQVDVVMGTLGKALGCAGACVWASHVVVDWLVNRARSFIYSTAQSPVVVASVARAIALLDEEPWRRTHVLNLAQHLRALLRDQGFNTLNSASQIVPVVLGESVIALQASAWLAQRGFWVSAIREPTVPKGSARLRMNLTAGHCEEQVKALVAALVQWREASLS